MPKRRILGILCTGAVALGLVISAQGAEPAFKHKTLSRWLKLYHSAEPGSAQETQSIVAIRSIGTNAVPRLVQMLVARDINVQQSAATGFEILGALGAPAIPALTNLLYGTNPVENVLAANSLGHIGLPALAALMDALTNHSYNVATLAALSLPEMGTNALPAVPVFLRDLRSRNHFVRERATDALGNLHLEPETVVPALTNLLNDSSLTARCMALNSLGQFKDAGSLAIPVIVPLLQAPEETIRISATNALCDIAPNEYKRPAPHALAN
jgi:HEAT repeat protein